jgi:hypothetical protein
MTPASARQAITERIAALVVSGYEGDAWTEARVPLVPEYDPEPKAQLSFFVDNRQITILPTRANALEPLLVGSVWTVRFLYRLRANARISDWDGSDAARVALWKHLLSWESELRLSPAPDFSTSRILGDWVVVETRFLVKFYSDAE